MVSTFQERTNAEDRAFILGVAKMARTMVDFALAEFSEAWDLPISAGRVLVWRKGQFQRIQTVLDECGSHGWNSTIYEAWEYETARRVKVQAELLGAIGASALIACAGDLMNASRSAAIEAIGEAQESLYGARTGILL